MAIQGLSHPGVLLCAIVLGAGCGILRCKPHARRRPEAEPGKRSRSGEVAAAGELPVSINGVRMVPRPVELDSRISREVELELEGPASEVEMEDEWGRRRPSFRRRVNGNQRCSPSCLFDEAMDKTSTLDGGREPVS